jgi:diacylglycerol kinase
MIAFIFENLFLYKIGCMKRFLKSLNFALNGLKLSFQLGGNFKIQLSLLLLSISLGLWFKIAQEEWLWIIVCSSAVLSLEVLNTAIEELCNRITKEEDEHIARIKDLSAGAVLIASISALIIGIIIFSKHISHVLF